MDIINLIKQGESKILEFKEILPKGDQLSKTVVAFSNTAGGKIIIGVNDKREIVGLNNEDIFELQDKIVSIIYDTCRPHISPEIYTKTIDGKIILVIEIYRGNTKPYYIGKNGIDQGVYVRIGATNRRADAETISDLRRQTLGLTYDEEIDYSTPFKEINLKILKEKFKSVDKVLNISKMKSLKLVREEAGTIYPTRGLLILLGLYDHVETQCANFKGNTPEEFIDKKNLAEMFLTN